MLAVLLWLCCILCRLKLLLTNCQLPYFHLEWKHSPVGLLHLCQNIECLSGQGVVLVYIIEELSKSLQSIPLARVFSQLRNPVNRLSGYLSVYQEMSQAANSCLPFLKLSNRLRI